MKKLFLLFTFVFFLFTPRAWAVIALSGSPAYDGTPGEPRIQFLSGNVNSLHDTALAVVCIATEAANDTTATVSDGDGSTWTRIASVATTLIRAELWRANDLLGANVAITVDLSQARLATATTAFYSGVAGIGLDSSTSGNGTALSLDLTTQDNNNWVIAGMCVNGGYPFTAVSGTIEAQISTYDPIAIMGNASAIVDSSSASPATLTSAANLGDIFDWAALAVELRSTTTPPSILVRRKPIIIQ